MDWLFRWYGWNTYPVIWGFYRAMIKIPISPTRFFLECHKGFVALLPWRKRVFFAANRYCSFLQQKTRFFFVWVNLGHFSTLETTIQPLLQTPSPTQSVGWDFDGLVKVISPQKIQDTPPKTNIFPLKSDYFSRECIWTNHGLSGDMLVFTGYNELVSISFLVPEKMHPGRIYRVGKFRLDSTPKQPMEQFGGVFTPCLLFPETNECPLEKQWLEDLLK